MSEPNYHTTKFLNRNEKKIETKAIEMKKKRDTSEKNCLFRTLNTRIKQEFWYDYVNPNYAENVLYGYRQFHFIHKNK